MPIATWRGDVGVVPKLIARAGFDPHNTVAMVCGPEVMMRFTAIALLGAGVPANHIYLSMERNMKCAIGLCGHCQFGPDFVCKDGPVMRLRPHRRYPYRAGDLRMAEPSADRGSRSGNSPPATAASCRCSIARTSLLAVAGRGRDRLFPRSLERDGEGAV